MKHKLVNVKYADEYIHQPTIGNMEQCRQHSSVIAPILKHLYSTGKLLGYTVAVIKNKEDADFNLLEENDYTFLTKRIFPFLLIVIQQKHDEPEVKIDFINEDYVSINIENEEYNL